MNDIIKMFIAGEEVVSNKEFTINEEMLSASSTILNNCYPKSWELTKDYVSNFYYPKDYSKFVLGKGNFLYGNNEFGVLSTSETSNLSFTTNVEKEWNSLNVYGNSYQNGTPTPDNPIEIQNVGYKNYYNGGNSTETNEIKFSRNSDGSYNINGTATAQANCYNYIDLSELMLVEGETYIFYTNQDLPSGVEILYEGFNNTTWVKHILTPLSNTTKYDTRQITLSTSNRVRCGIRVANGTSVNISNLKISIVKGNATHSYIPYGKYGIEVITTGKNLFDLNTAYHGTINASGVIGSNESFRTSNYIPTQPNTTYYFSTTQISGQTSKQIYIAYYNKNGSFLSRDSYNLYENAFTTPANCYYMRAGVYTDGQENVMLEKGNAKTTYEAYKSNTQLYTLDNPLRAIGNVKDKLYIENGYLYVERKIGSVVLNGTENWNIGSSATTRSVFLLNTFTDKLSGVSNFMSDNFSYRGNAQSENLGYAMSFNTGTYKNYMYIQVPTDVVTSQNVNAFKTWLSTHNTEVQYVLQNSTIETVGQVNLPTSYENQNNVSFYTQLDTTEDIFYYWRNYDILFAGIVKNSGDISLNPRYPHYCSLQILDYKTFLSESDTLDFVISEKTILEAIQMVVEKISGYGFVLGNININSAYDVIGAYSTLNKTAYDVFQYLADISGSRWRARFVDTNTMAIDFYDPELLPQASDIDYTKQYWEDNDIVDLTFNYGTRDYRNKQVLLSDEVYSNIDYTEIILGDGYNNTFTTENNIAIVNSIIVDGEEVEFITTSEKELGAEADFYYTPGKNIIESEMTYSAGTQITINYIPLVKGRQIIFNNDEVARITEQTSTTGVIARYETRNDIFSSEQLEKIAETYIQYKGKPEVILTLTTKDNDLYNIGEVVYFNAPIEDLQQNYMVKSKKTQYIVNGEQINLFYVYEMTSSFNSEKAINYFDNQRNKATGNIGEGESITRNVDINNTATIIWNNPTITEVSISPDNDNVLNAPISAPFIQ